jgi:hypothetical protein
VCEKAVGPEGTVIDLQVSVEVQAALRVSPRSGSLVVPENETDAPRATVREDDGAERIATGAWFPEGGIWSSQIPRPCVASRRREPSAETRRS